MTPPCSLELISHDTVFFSHNKTVSVGLSAETISRTEIAALPACEDKLAIIQEPFQLFFNRLAQILVALQILLG